MAESRFSAGNKKSRTRYIIGGLIISLLCLVPVLSFGRIKDDIACGECHTMHNSQNMSSMTGGSAEQALLVSTCIGCHTGTNAASSYVPYVYTTSEPTYGLTGTAGGHTTLAGGNFYWVQSADPDHNRMGHNVAGIADPDDELGNIPPGGTDIGGQLTCAGQYGCHGDRTKSSDLDALRPGSHHVEDDPTDSTYGGSDVPQSYRFLLGVKGFEDSDWEFTVSDADHNQYNGATDGGAAATDTISYFCASCHGDFHNGDTSSPFLRHPTDISLPTSGEHGAYTTYDPAVPVASTDITSQWSDISDPDNRIVACISCHRAHGSPYDSILRWDYKSWPNGGYNGCAVCHSYKN